MAEPFEPLQADVSALAGRRVLIAEDSAEDANKFMLWLTIAGVHTATVGTLAEARQALRERRWDAVVIDRILSDGDAFEWLRREYREQGGRLTIPPCVLVSGHLDEKTYRIAYDIGVVPLPKHYLLHPDVLLAALGSAIHSSKVSAAADELDAALRHPLLPKH